MKKWIKILIWIIATPIILLIIALVAYVIVNRQGVIEPYSAGDPAAEKRVLIASQGSEFKEQLVAQLVDRFSNEQMYISVLDCTALDGIDGSDWDAIIMLHTMQIHKMPKEARRFLERQKDLSRTMLVCTSGGGDEIIAGFAVDAISSPSRLSRLPEVVAWINFKMAEKLNKEVITVHKR
jgi:hypothetical protein